jgi:hypothetical protein
MGAGSTDQVEMLVTGSTAILTLHRSRVCPSIELQVLVSHVRRRIAAAFAILPLDDAVDFSLPFVRSRADS